MSHTLLDAVNETLKRVNVIAGTAGLLSSLTSSAIQHNIDIAVQVINEGIDELYSTSGTSMPKQSAQSTITLALGTREYSLATDLERLHWPMIDRTNTQYLFLWPQSYDDLLLLDPQQAYTGLPIWGIISPDTNMLRVDRAPDSASTGKVYTYQYDRDTVLVNATDAIPFNDPAFRAMVPAWAQLYRRGMRLDFDADLYTQAVGRASRMAIEEQQRTSYDPRA